MVTVQETRAFQFFMLQLQVPFFLAIQLEVDQAPTNLDLKETIMRSIHIAHVRHNSTACLLLVPCI